MMMKVLILAVSMITLLNGASGQSAATSQVVTETKGSCSPIAPDNQGSITITCTGFSEKQNRQILGFIKQLSSDQAKDQEALLAKLDEVLAAIKASNGQSQRTISDEIQQRMRPSLDQFGGQIVQINAPSGDMESSNLALRIKEILGAMGWQVLPVKYGAEPPPPENGFDFMIRTSGSGGSQAPVVLADMLIEFADLKTRNRLWENRDVLDPQFKIPSSFVANNVIVLYIYSKANEARPGQKIH
jgi:hypothetical protein